MPNYFHIRCTIERGGFTSERTFEIHLADGARLVGTAYIEHLCGENKKPLPDDQPFGEVINGFVKCRKIRDIDESTVLVEVPSADVVHVAADDLVEMDC